jgi:uncharacterized repeat protein (TIGR03803 family)
VSGYIIEYRRSGGEDNQHGSNLIGRSAALLWASALVCMCMASADARGQISEVVLHGFGTPPNGANPISGALRDASGNLFGATPTGGQFAQGVVYKVSPAGAITVLHAFTRASDGAQPQAGLAMDAAGNLYGTSPRGGASNHGVVYRGTCRIRNRQRVLVGRTPGPRGAPPAPRCQKH